MSTNSPPLRETEYLHPTRDDIAEFRSRGQLANEIRIAVNRLFPAVGDPPRPATRQQAPSAPSLPSG
jgi:hypothetical protein